MKAIGYIESLPLTDASSLMDIDIPQPQVSGRDLLVKISAIAVNPVDFKIRQNVSGTDEAHKVLGWDAVGEVVASGGDVALFEPGDMVFYAGDLNRSGSNAEYQLVDERLVGRKPKSLSNAEAAAMPLTTITAWEMLFEHLALEKVDAGANDKSGEILLIVGASGGVGSIMVQLAKHLTGATIIATASRQSSSDWVKELGADYVVDHSQPLAPQIEALGIGAVTHVASLTHTDSYLDTYVEVLKPMGRIALIDDPQSLDISKLKPKSISLHWEFMFTRSMYQTEDMEEQHKLLNAVADLIDKGVIKTTLGKHLGKINAANLREAHALLESGKSIGKIVLEGF
jgi:zinc-binding alcohol dehydrogenase family protein